jgi:hypothetical protein
VQQLQRIEVRAGPLACERVGDPRGAIDTKQYVARSRRLARGGMQGLMPADDFRQEASR